MDNLTHSLTGLVLAKSGLERLSPAATPLCVVVANAPDFDILTLLTGDRWIYLHRPVNIPQACTRCLPVEISP